jgi:methyl-accepting chemotaxis protein
VVADEVRNLAARSAGAAKETAEIIDRSLRKVELGTQMAHRTSGHLDDIVVSVNEAATLVSDIAAASSEQSTAIDQVEGALNQVTSVTQQNTTNAGDCASASEELAAQVDTLRNLLAEFRLGRERSHEGRGNHEGRGAHEGRSRPGLGGPAPRRSAAGNEGRGGRYVPPPIDEADFGRY